MVGGFSVLNYKNYSSREENVDFAASVVLPVLVGAFVCIFQQDSKQFPLY